MIYLNKKSIRLIVPALVIASTLSPNFATAGIPLNPSPGAAVTKPSPLVDQVKGTPQVLESVIQEAYQNNRIRALEERLSQLMVSHAALERKAQAAERQVTGLSESLSAARDSLIATSQALIVAQRQINETSVTVATHSDSVLKVPGMLAKIDQLETVQNTLARDSRITQERTTAIESRTQHIRDTIIDGKTSVIIESANLVLRNGSGNTNTSNGLGNVILGYHAAPEFVPAGLTPNRSGSHNLVIGDGHQYSGHSNLISGSNNRVTSSASAVLSGINNSIVSGRGSAILGGIGNSIEGPSHEYSSISGGAGNIIRNSNSSVISGGEVNLIDSQSRGLIVGGLRNALLNRSDYGVIIGGENSRLMNSPFSVHGGGSGYTLSNESYTFSAETVLQ